MKMFPISVRMFYSLLVCTFAVISLQQLSMDVQAQFSSNPDDYDISWIVVGDVSTRLPTCSYCLNALGPIWSNYASIYTAVWRCVGVGDNELWAFQNTTQSIIVASSFQTPLCLNALSEGTSHLGLSLCNSSMVTQQWTKEGNLLRNGQTSSDGKPLYLWAGYPNGLEYDSKPNISAVYPLLIAASPPVDLHSYILYTSSFSFLSTANLVNLFNSTGNPGLSQGTLKTTSLVLIGNYSSPDQIVNGGFESSTFATGKAFSSNTVLFEYFALCGWVMDAGSINYVNSGLLQPQNGNFSVHLNDAETGQMGSITQTFPTEIGAKLVLSFWFNAFPSNVSAIVQCDQGYQVGLHAEVTNASTMDVSWKPISDGTGFQQTFAYSAELTADTFREAWQYSEVVFMPSTNITNVSFRSWTQGSCGPMIDSVAVLKFSPTSRAPQSGVAPERGVNTVQSPQAAVEIVVPAVCGAVITLVAIILVIRCGVRYCRTDAEYVGLYKTEHARLYSVRQLSNATKKFSSVLGEGGFGTVYKAEFSDGTVAAVKVEKPKGPHSSSKVLASDEILVLLRVHHRNLVNLIGFCIDKGRHLLVFEYLPNGSLYDRLHHSILNTSQWPDLKSQSFRPHNLLTWKQRVRIIKDVASGLEYLHHEADPPIAHRDIKSQNILLTGRDSAKLADFGLSKAAPIDATSFQSTETLVKGSIGYLDPQYLSTGVFSAKSDVYSFGVVILEIISGHPAIYNAVSLASWASPYMTSPLLYHEIVDDKLNGDLDAIELEALVDLSRMCMEHDGKMRPSMRDVVAFLNNTLGRVDIVEEASDVMGELKPQKNNVNSQSFSGSLELACTNSY